MKILWLSGVRAYTYNFPIDKGKYRLIDLAKYIGGEAEENLIAKSKDGRKFSINFKDWSEDFIYFFGSYEPLCTEIFTKMVKPGDICFDVGANIGWYTTLFGMLCGLKGEVHSFEPIPDVFQRLRHNVSLNELNETVRINNYGLGNEEKISHIHIFEGQPSGHSSLFGRPDEKSSRLPVRIDTLNNYLETEDISRVDFIKVDIEGAELLFLQGGDDIFSLDQPPTLLMEMVANTSQNFGYVPNDLIEFIDAKRKYKFYKINEAARMIENFEKFEPEDAGANILCVPAGQAELRLPGIKIK